MEEEIKNEINLENNPLSAMSRVEEGLIIRTEEVNEILSAPPHWLFRWGISIVFIVIILGFVLAYFIKYPDTLAGTTTITTLNPPANIVAKTGGKLTHLLVQNNQTVKTNEVLAIIENTADYNDVLILQSQMDSLALKVKLSDNLPSFQFTDSIKLGDITTNYLLFLRAYKDYKLFVEINPQQQEIALLNRELLNYTSLLDRTEKQSKLYTEEFSLIEKDYERDNDLYKQKLISAREFENKKKEFLSAQRNVEAQKINVTNIKITANNIEKSKLQLQIQYVEQLNKFKNELDQTIKNLQTQINTWKQNFLFISPIDGKISFFNYWTVNQNVKAGDNIFSIVPIVKQELIAKLILPTGNSGKVKVGQDVNIKLDSYPYTEYGMLRGKVKNISLVPTNNSYVVDVVLPKGLITSYNKTLTYKEEMTATAEIITENLSVLDRVVMKFRKIVTK